MERNDKAAIEALLKRHGFHFSKSMGQNFLIDPAIPYRDRRELARQASRTACWRSAPASVH